MSSKTPVYVAGLDRGVRPMGLWSMFTTLSKNSMPSMPPHLPGRVFMRFSSAPSFLKRISLTRDDFPLPETPVTTVKVPRGKETSMFLRLFSRAPRTVRNFPFPCRLRAGTSMRLRPLRYCPVRELGSAMTSSGVPAETTSPPWTPAPGPMSMR